MLSPRAWIKPFFLASLFFVFAGHPASAQNPGPPLLNGDGSTDNTEALQKVLSAGAGEVNLEPGRYLLGTLDIPANTTIKGKAGVKLVINPAKLRSLSGGPASKDNPLCLFALKGGNVRFEALEFDFSLTEDPGIKANLRPDSLFAGRDLERLCFSRLAAVRPEPVKPLPLEQRNGGRYPQVPANKASFNLVQLWNCRDIILEDSRAEHMLNMLDLFQCSRVISRYNQAVSCRTITSLNSGDEYLWHIGNWSRDVWDQCRWWGGNSNDKRNLDAGDEGWKTGSMVTRGIKEGEANYNRYTAGSFDIMVSNNYAEYGRILAWGSKGREVVFSGNIGRFMGDYVLGSEGGENVVFSNNITLNGRTCGLATYYWSDKTVMTGNVVVVGKQAPDPTWSWFAKPETYQGGLLRLHAVAGRSSTETGSGQIVISDNVFTNELSDQTRKIAIEAGRDVLIANNKITNGEIITKRDSGSLTVRGNDFTLTTATRSACISIHKNMEKAVIQNNTFKRSGGEDSGFPAILAEAESNSSPLLRIIDGNNLEGFVPAIRALSWSKKTPDRFLIRNNSSDGNIFLGQLSGKGLFEVSGNVDLATMKVFVAKPELFDPSALKSEATGKENDLPLALPSDMK